MSKTVLFGTVARASGMKACQDKNVLYSTLMEKDGSAQPMGKREERKRDRRQAIVSAARKAFLEDGYAAMSMSGLLKTLGGSKATLWGYFHSKDELFAAVIDDVTTSFREDIELALSDGHDIEPTLASFSQRFMTTTTTHESLSIWRLVVAESERFPEVGRIFYERIVIHLEGALAQYLAAQVARGALIDHDPMAMARTLIALCFARQNRMLWGIEAMDPSMISAEAATNTRYFMRLFGSEERDHTMMHDSRPT